MPKPKLPTGFKIIFRRLLREGTPAPEAMKEAWRRYKVQSQRYAMRKSVEGNPRHTGKRGRYIRERLKSPKGLYHMRTVSVGRGHKVVIGCPVEHRGKRCPVATVAQAVLHPLREGARKSARNPIAVYNPGIVSRAARQQGKVFYGRILEIRGMKTDGAHRGRGFKHRFSTPVEAVGLPEGNVLLRSKRGVRLWDYERNI